MAKTLSSSTATAIPDLQTSIEAREDLGDLLFHAKIKTSDGMVLWPCMKFASGCDEIVQWLDGTELLSKRRQRQCTVAILKQKLKEPESISSTTPVLYLLGENLPQGTSRILLPERYEVDPILMHNLALDFTDADLDYVQALDEVLKVLEGNLSNSAASKMTWRSSSKKELAPLTGLSSTIAEPATIPDGVSANGLPFCTTSRRSHRESQTQTHVSPERSVLESVGSNLSDLKNQPTLRLASTPTAESDSDIQSSGTKKSKNARISMEPALAENSSQKPNDVTPKSASSETRTRTSTRSSQGSALKASTASLVDFSAPSTSLTLKTSSVQKSKVSTAKKSNRKKPLLDDTSLEPIPTFHRVRKLLIKCGFLFRQNTYCRPGMDPRRNPLARKGEDYFDNEHDFRKHVCAYGLNCSSLKLTKDEETLVTQWVRYAIVDFAADATCIPQHELLSVSRAEKLLLDVGVLDVKYINGIDDAYVYPGTSKDSYTFGMNAFIKGGNNTEMFMNLARFGIPDGCDFSKVSRADFLSLQLHLTEPGTIDTFGTFEDPFPSDTVVPRTRTRRMSTTTPAKVPQEYQKGKRAISNYSPTNISTVTNDSVCDNSSVVADRNEKKRKAKASSSKPMKSPRTVSTVDAEKDRTSGDRSLSAPETYAAKWAPLFEALELPNIEIELPCEGLTNEQKLTECLERLNASSEAIGFSVPRDGAFAKNLGSIYDFIMENVSDGTMGSNGNSALYVCGVPGIGKTTGVKWCCDKSLELIQREKSDRFRTPLFCVMSAASLNSVKKFEETLFSSMASAISSVHDTKEGILRKLQRVKEKAVLFLVLDEIDHLVLVKQGSSKKRTGGEKILQWLLDWAADPKIPFALIGISNSIGNDRFGRLHEIGKFRNTVTFSSYDHNEIVSILKSRVGNRIVAPNALTFIAKKVQQSSGDARKALEDMSLAIKFCLDSLSDSEKTSRNNAILVNMQHAVKVFSVVSKDFQERILTLPYLSKVILCVVVTLAQAKVSTTTVGILKRAVTDCVMQTNEDELVSLENFQFMLADLVDKGLLCFEGKGSEDDLCQQQHMPVRLGTQLDDVEQVLEKDLSQQQFFGKLRALARDRATEFRR